MDKLTKKLINKFELVRQVEKKKKKIKFEHVNLVMNSIEINSYLR